MLMAKPKTIWKKGRGKLGPLEPLIGSWEAATDTPMGPVKCTRELVWILSENYLQLTANWHFGPKVYREIAIIGVDPGGPVTFWSFTNDGKRSQGVLTDVTDIHPEAVGFEAEMPAGTARMVYWPAEDEGFYWAVESKNKSGWKRFTEHHYHRIEATE
jgi:hypothetical protein